MATTTKQAEIETYLSEKEFTHDGIGTIEIGDLSLVTVAVEWGDWKHSHIYLDRLMEKKDMLLLTESLTEEDGSDCYSSIHVYYAKEDSEKVELYRELFATVEEE